jgi:hypothetical protein
MIGLAYMKNQIKFFASNFEQLKKTNFHLFGACNLTLCFGRAMEEGGVEC